MQVALHAWPTAAPAQAPGQLPPATIAVGPVGQLVGGPAHAPVAAASHKPDAWQVTVGAPPYVQFPVHIAPIAAPAQLTGQEPLLRGAVGEGEQLVGGPAHAPVAATSQDPLARHVTLALPPYVQLAEQLEAIAAPPQLVGHEPLLRGAVGTAGQRVGGPAHAPADTFPQAPDARQVTLALPPYMQAAAQVWPMPAPAHAGGHAPCNKGAVGTAEQLVGGPAHAPVAVAPHAPEAKHATDAEAPYRQLAEQEAPTAAPAQAGGQEPSDKGVVGTPGQLEGGAAGAIHNTRHSATTRVKD